MNNKILLTTVYSGYNYGSCLQALASKLIIQSTGNECKLVKLKSLFRGRDIRLNKVLTIIWRSLLLANNKAIATYKESYKKHLSSDSKKLFDLFIYEFLTPEEVTLRQLKSMGKEALACFSGSDQIWNSSSLYVDPIYYLRFAPKEKRVALAPSFGRDFIAEYNIKKISHWINEYQFLSVREDSGVELIKNLTGRTALHLLDPTLIIRHDEWIRILNINSKKKNKYILAYFLDEPSLAAKTMILQVKQHYECDVIGIPYSFDNMNYCDYVLSAGPKEFVELISNAEFVLTDSFHGCAFSINMHTPFYVFEREYKSANRQSERVLSLLRKMDMLNRFQPSDMTDYSDINFNFSDKILNEERGKTYNFVKNAVSEISKK